MSNDLKNLWEKEYLDTKGIPTSHQDTPSHALPIFLDYLNKMGIHLAGNILDLGCGKGRNSLELLRNFQGEVYGIDISPSALQAFQSRAKDEGFASNIHVIEGNLANPLPYPNEFFDFALDIASSFRLTEDKEIDEYIQEVYRVLKQKGILLLYLISRDDEYYRQILASSPRREEGIFLDPKEKFPGRLYSQKELSDLWGKKFSIRLMQELEFEGEIHGQKCIRHLLLSIFQK